MTLPGPGSPRPPSNPSPLDRAASFWQAPLALAALSATAGVLADRYAGMPLPLSLLAVVGCLAAWTACSMRGRESLAVVWLVGSLAPLGAAYHHWWREAIPEDDISRLATPEPRPAVLRGVLVEEPVTPRLADHDALRSFDPRVTTRAVLRVCQAKGRDGWLAVSGQARLSVVGIIRPPVHVGDEIEVIGRLVAPAGPSNPGESDYASYLRDQQIGAIIHVREAPEAVTLLADRTLTTTAGWLALIRSRAHRTLAEVVPEKQQGLAMALLLGEDWELDQSSWHDYQVTGVLQVLAISGQHLVVLGAFLGFCFRPLRVRRRYVEGCIALFLLGYSLMVGGRPPIMRAAVMVCALRAGLLLRRPKNTANLFALAWLAVLVLNPTDMFTGGCQLSFLAVAVLVWGIPTDWSSRSDSLLADLSASQLGLLGRGVRRIVRQVALVYLVNSAVVAALAPLVAYRYHTVPPVALLISPPAVLCTDIALITGFVALLLSPLCWPLTRLIGPMVGRSLDGCDLVVQLGKQLPGAYRYVADVPAWWVWIFYLVLLAAITIPVLRPRWLQIGIGLAAWLCVPLLLALMPVGRPDELRCTFLAVGHGGCTILETPDGRTLLYDVGAIAGPDVTRKYVAPYLWRRGIRRLDEVFLSHADLDHYNGLAELLERFAVGQLTLTPTFSEHDRPSVRLTVEVVRQRGVPTRVVHAGDRLTAGEVTLDVLHPPAVGPQGNENARSMVLLVRHQGHSILLTGDLEGTGLDRVLSLPGLPVDVLMAPHHGSRKSNKIELARWGRPRLAVSCQGPPRWPPRSPDPYEAVNAKLLTTWEHGAVAIRSSADRLTVETYKTAERWSIPPRPAALAAERPQ